MRTIISLLFVLGLYSLCFSSLQAEKRQMEYLNRGLVAVKTDHGVFLSWRFLGTETKSTSFNIYRNNDILLNTYPLFESTNFVDSLGTLTDTYTVKTLVNNKEDRDEKVISVTPWEQQYKTLQLNRPVGGTTPDGLTYSYVANDCSVGDLDGDGEYEIVLKWDPTNAKDNSQSGYTGDVYLDAIN